MLADLQACQSRMSFADLLGVTPRELAHTLFKIPDAAKYQSFCVNKKNGKTRFILAPCPPLKWLQTRLLNVLYECEDDTSIDPKAASRLQHGFLRGTNIYNNADVHKKQRFVFNIDLEDFFDQFNFGRVRGFFIKDKRFLLHKDVATAIAQIACFQDKLPQGSPCSPYVASLASEFLDVRLTRFLSPRRCFYSRYADDITISTSLRGFPSDVALEVDGDPQGWQASPALEGICARAGFDINSGKTRMSQRHSRQMVTGLVVNDRPNVPREFYLRTRAMCDHYFRNGKIVAPPPFGGFGKPCEKDADPSAQPISLSLSALEGRLSHIHHIREASDLRGIQEKQETPTQFWTQLQRFYLFKHFFINNLPVILTEGPSDIYYIKSAISETKVPTHNIIDPSTGKPTLVRFFRFDGEAARVLGVTGGSGNIKRLLYLYSKGHKSFNKALNVKPVIILIDNDSGGADVISMINGIYKTRIKIDDPGILYKLEKGLYLIKTPHTASSNKTCIEDMLPPEVRKVKLNGKTFSSASKLDTAKHFGKVALASYVQQNAGTISFSGFDAIITAIDTAIADTLK
ncbi:retron Ec67 family RNA-directed DNA polymerase/endonuclease [Sphingomonas sp.]|jgi:hypothetical protein|uniref:retron Ec67 family RNA-directed DNA polymerase/endonuclease n=1 Tax=Sphingomonas sp. TaxID=28214 RepID=UPI002D7E777E|nr:retron Ec67 family RNA-directed DNA polymerase/endonuclease [Sphingomonas sp.]HEU0045872.1 retron Ec67 family RNA-directed DNA polymerase/endonuclease [Sphingomonas sp.]